MNPWTFFDFLDIRGNNLIRPWIDSLPLQAAAKIDARMIFMCSIRIWPEQYVSALVGWPELFEFRIVSAGSQYRLLFFYGPGRGEVTLVHGTIEKGKLSKGTLAYADGNRKFATASRERIAEHIFRTPTTPR